MIQSQWQLSDAKNRFSELVNKALEEGPQVVTRRGEEVVTVISTKTYRQLQMSQSSLLEFFRSSPLVDVALELDRDRSLPREIEL